MATVHKMPVNIGGHCYRTVPQNYLQIIQWDIARDWRQRERERANRASRGAFVPLVFAPGEAVQFDWSEDWIRIGGKKTKLQMAHFKLCHTRAFFLRAYLTQTHEMVRNEDCDTVVSQQVYGLLILSA